MTLAYISYLPTDSALSLPTVKRRLPEALRQELMSGSQLTDYGICIDAAKRDAITRLEDYLGVGRSHEYLRTLHVEVDRTELGQFDYFTITPHDLELDRDVFYEMTPKSCNHLDTCPWNSEIIQPIRLLKRALRPLTFGVLSSHWEMAVYLVISAELRRLFAAAGVTGLEFVPCQLQDERGTREPTSECFLARITHRVTEHATHVIPRANYCSQHSTVLIPYVFVAALSRTAVVPADFVAVHSIQTRTAVYHYYRPWWFVSRKVLKILLLHKVPALRFTTLILKERFKPVILS